MKWMLTISSLLAVLGMARAEPSAEVPALMGDNPEVLVADAPLERRFVGDWETPDALMLVANSDWPDTVDAILEVASPTVPIVLLTDRDGEWERIQQSMGWSAAIPDTVQFEPMSIDSAWVRDYGPLQVHERSGETVWLDAGYDPERPNDDVVPLELASRMSVPWETLPFDLDGGALIANGEGLCVSTIDYFHLNQLDPEDADLVEQLLHRLGCRVLALPPALSHEPTKHVDMFAQFVSPRRLLVAEPEGPTAGEDRQRMKEAIRIVRAAAKRLGFDLEIGRVPMPIGEERIHYSYLNGVRAGGMFLVPRYDEVAPEQEQRAYRTLADWMPEVQIVPIPSDQTIKQDGAIHCMTLGLHLPPVREAKSPVVQQSPKPPASEAGQRPRAN